MGSEILLQGNELGTKAKYGFGLGSKNEEMQDGMAFKSPSGIEKRYWSKYSLQISNNTL